MAVRRPLGSSRRRGHRGTRLGGTRCRIATRAARAEHGDRRNDSGQRATPHYAHQSTSGGALHVLSRSAVAPGAVTYSRSAMSDRGPLDNPGQVAARVGELTDAAWVLSAMASVLSRGTDAPLPGDDPAGRVLVAYGFYEENAAGLVPTAACAQA